MIFAAMERAWLALPPEERARRSAECNRLVMLALQGEPEGLEALGRALFPDLDGLAEKIDVEVTMTTWPPPRPLTLTDYFAEQVKIALDGGEP